MAILDIQTDNQDISWIIKKNPETQKATNMPFQRNLRKGEVLSWYITDNYFRTYFREKTSESSFYKHLDNNYLNQSAYNCPYAYCSMISENFSGALKEIHEKDKVCFNKIVLQQIFISNNNIVKLFQKHFEQISIDITHIEHKVATVTFSGNVTINYLLKIVQILTLILSIEDKNVYIEVNESLAKKYAQYLLDIDAPYFIVYLFNSRLINDFTIFKSVNEMFKLKQWDLYYGNTQKQRYDQIKKFITGGKVLNDIGCGELYYSRYFKDIYEQVFAWDAEKSIQERNSKYLTKKAITNIYLKDEFTVESMNSDKETDLLITEMLEHVPKAKAIEFLQNINKKQFRNLVITLPNKDFNQFYKLGEEFRHDDHCWEPTYTEALDMIQSIFNDKLKVVKKIGDRIKDISVSTLFVIENNV